jgi:serine-type D-Ala-D-Ala carboxypeptidase
VRGEPARLDPGRLDVAFALAQRQVAEGRATGAALAVATSAGMVRSEAFRHGARLAEPHRSAIASITKPITAVAVLQQVEAGALVLHEPLSMYLPAFAGTNVEEGSGREAITAWHLLTHTSGLADADDAWYETTEPTPANLVARLSTLRPTFPPGTAYQYATDTFYVLAALIEHFTGRSYREVLAERILDPLGMTMTGFDPETPGPSLPLEGHFGPPGMPREMINRVFRELAMPGGGLWSTGDDVARFGRAMLLGGALNGTRVLGRPFLELMLRRHTANLVEVGSGRPPDYGLGWGFPGLGRGLPCSAAAFGHSGATGSMLIVDPTWDLVFVHLRNEWGATITATDEVIQAVYAALD